MIKQTIIFVFGLLISFSTSFAQQKSTNEKLIIGGFGELHYNDITYNKNGRQTPGVLDFHRFNFTATYNFNNLTSFHSELGLTHSLDRPDTGGQITLEQAYIDVKIHQLFGLRTGILLVPLGLVNLNRTPLNFFGVERPSVEKYIIPTTWKEAGIGLYGSTKFGLSYKLYALAGLKPSGINREYGIREARQNSFESSTANIALAGRVDYQINSDIMVGISCYLSTLQNRIDGGIEHVKSLNDGLFSMGEGHAEYQKNRFLARGLFALSKVWDVEDLNMQFGNRAGQIQAGGYIELGYDILPFFIATEKYRLFTFTRYESYDTNFRTAAVPRNNIFLHDEITAGLHYEAFEHIVIKADYQLLTSFAGARFVEKLNLGIGYSF